MPDPDPLDGRDDVMEPRPFTLPTRSCGGCAGKGAHSRACRSPLEHLADLVEGIGDTIGANIPGQANMAYRIAGELRAHAARCAAEPGDAEKLVRALAIAYGQSEAMVRTNFGLSPA